MVLKGSATHAASLSLSLNTGSYVGTVTDLSSGYAIWGATVDIYNSANVWIASTSTASDGSYAVAGLSAGSYNVSVSSYGYITQYANDVPVQSGTTTLENFSMLLSTGALAGRVTDYSTGGVIPGATITVTQNGWWIASATSGFDGHYWISGLAPGLYDVTVDSYGYNGATLTSLNVYAATTDKEDFSLSVVTGSVSGVVTDYQSGYSLSGAAISISQNGYVVANTWAASDGSYEVDGLVPGNYSIDVSAYGYDAQSDSISISGGYVTSDNFSMVITTGSGSTGGTTSTGVIAGYVSDYSTGYAIAGATVYIYDQYGNLAASGSTDSNGYYDIYGLAPGTYNVISSSSGYSDDEVDGDVVYANNTTNQDMSMN